MPASEEPRHHVALQNNFVRVLDVHILPGDTTKLHRHSLPSVIVYLTNSIRGGQTEGDKPFVSPTKIGHVDYAAYEKNPVTHRVWNDGRDTFHVMDIELLHQPLSMPDTSRINTRSGFILNQRQVTVTYSKINKREGFQFLGMPDPQLFICYAGKGTMHVGRGTPDQPVIPGHFYWVDAGMDFGFSAAENEDLELVVLELYR